MTADQSIWAKQHERYAQSDWIDKPTLFAEWAVQHFPQQGTILELGCGQGQDTRFFAERGFSVTGLDSSERGIALAQEKTQGPLNSSINYQVKDFSQPLDFADKSFDIVYSHLALHYFSAEETEKMFSEIYRVLKNGGVLAFLVNSTKDTEFSEGVKIEDNYFDIREIKKRFFDLESTRSFIGNFEEVVLDNQGETYKDRIIGTHGLIRFIGIKH